MCDTCKDHRDITLADGKETCCRSGRLRRIVEENGRQYIVQTYKCEQCGADDYCVTDEVGYMSYQWFCAYCQNKKYCRNCQTTGDTLICGTCAVIFCPSCVAEKNLVTCSQCENRFEKL